MPSRSREFWEGRYRRAQETGASLWGAAPNGWIDEQVAALGGAPGRALDLGAGEGRNALRLAELGWRVTAVDFAPAAIEGLRVEAGERGLSIDAVVGDATTWSGAPCDLAVLCYLQLEPAALAAAIAAAASALDAGGVLLGIWHDRADVQRGTGGAMSPAIRTTPEETRAAAAAAGLAVELSGGRDRTADAGVVRDCLLIARR